MAAVLMSSGVSRNFLLLNLMWTWYQYESMELGFRFWRRFSSFHEQTYRKPCFYRFELKSPSTEPIILCSVDDIKIQGFNIAGIRMKIICFFWTCRFLLYSCNPKYVFIPLIACIGLKHCFHASNRIFNFNRMTIRNESNVFNESYHRTFRCSYALYS